MSQIGHRAHLTKLVIKRSENLRIQSVSVSPYYCEFCYDPTGGANGIVLLENTNRVSLVDVESFTAPQEYISQNWDIRALTGETEPGNARRGNGIKAKGENAELLISFAKVYSVLGGVSIAVKDGSFATLENSQIDFVGPEDAIHTGGGHINILRNRVTNIVRWQNDGAHCDLLQMQPTTKSAIIRGNIFLQQTSTHPMPELAGVAQGIFGGQSCSPCVVENNIIANDHNHGINIAGDQPFTHIVNNTVIDIGDQVAGTSPIITSGEDNVVANNIAHSYSLSESVNQSNNLTITRHDWGALFVNAEEMDFRLRGTSTAVDRGRAGFLLDSSLPDAAGNPRIVGVEVDLGALEYRP